MFSWLVKAANLPVPELTGDVCSDVPMTHKYAPYIKTAFDMGLAKPDKDNKFYPDKAVNESEGEDIFRQFGVIR